MSWLREDKFLLLCCQTEIGDKDRDWLDKTQRDKIDWDYFLKKARREGISPLVFIRLPGIIINKNDIPEYVTDELRKDYLTTFRTSFTEIMVTTSFSRHPETIWLM